MAISPQSMGVAQPVPADEHVFLIGRPPIGEFLGFIQAQTVEGQSAERSALMDQWRAANDHIRQLESKEAGWADGAPIQPLTGDLEPLRDEVLNDPVTRASFGMVPIEIGVVELDRLVVFQKQINVEYVRELGALLGASPSQEDVFRFCLPFDRRYDPGVQSSRLAQNAWAFVSPSRDFRQLESVLLDPTQVPGLVVAGAPVAIVAQVVGYGPNYLSIVQAEDRLVLFNGSHRAYALREAGHTHVPCLIQRVSRRDELELLGSDEVTQQADRYLSAPRPPVLRDYFDPQLRMTVHVPRSVMQVQVAVNAQAVVVPRGSAGPQGTSGRATGARYR
jgi:hypothetical protein